MPLSHQNSECSGGLSVSEFSEALSMESYKAKFNVCLENGRKIAVPISGTAIVTELHVLFGDDLLEDLFDRM